MTAPWCWDSPSPLAGVYGASASLGLELSGWVQEAEHPEVFHHTLQDLMLEWEAGTSST
jgi:hypothetical protein